MESIIFFHRNKSAGFSIDKVTKTVISGFREKKEYYLPLCGGSLSVVFRNIFFTWKHRDRGAINHMTGDAQYVILALVGCKSVLTVHDTVSLEFNKMGHVKKFVFEWLWYRLPLKFATKVVCISEETRREEREKLGFKDDDVCFIFMGRLNHDKGIGELYEAFSKLIPECPNAKLVLYGHDEEGYDAKAETYANIKRDANYFYPGHTSAPFASLQAGDVFVLPTWREGFGMSVLEAQGLALPAITSDAYGVVDATAEGKTALRFHVGDAEGLYQCMKAYYDSSELRKEHGLAGRKRVEDSFVGSKVSEAWVEFYQKMLS